MKQVSVNLYANRLRARVTGAIAQDERVSVTATGDDWTPVDGDYLLRLTRDGSTLVSGTLVGSDGTLTGEIDMATAAVDALFTSPATRAVDAYLLIWHAATKHLVCQTEVQIERNDPAA